MFIEIISVIGLICILEYFAKKLKTARLQSWTGLPNLPIIGSAHLIMTLKPSNFHWKMAEYRKLYGNSFYCWIFGYFFAVTCEPKYVEKILSNSKEISKNMVYTMLRPWLGDGLLITDGTDWQMMRKVVTPAFHFGILERYIEVFDRQSLMLVKKLRSHADGRKIVDIYPFLGKTTLDIIVETAIGVKNDAENTQLIKFRERIKEVIEIYAIRSIRPHLLFTELFKLFQPRVHKQQVNGIHEIHNVTRNIIKMHRLQSIHSTESVAPKDNSLGIEKRMGLLDILLRSTIDDKPLTDQRIIAEISTVIFAGHDTTSSAASFTLWLLSRHREVQQKLYDEIKKHFGDDLDRPMTFRDLQDLPYLNCVLKEAMRLYPPVPVIGRLLNEDLEIDGNTLPAGTNFSIFLWELHRDPRIYPEPEKFKPERFIEVENTFANSFSYAPFSAGQRNCVGQRFALLELKCITIRMLQNYELLPLGEDLQLTFRLVLVSDNGIQIGIKPRKH